MTLLYVYDVGALIAFDSNDRWMWARHKLALDEGRDIHVPAVVVGQAWRDGRRQVQFARALAGCRPYPVGLDTSKAAGVLCGRSGTADVLDATVVGDGRSAARDHLDLRRRRHHIAGRSVGLL